MIKKKIRHELKIMLDNKENYDFPCFLQALRKLYSLSVRKMAQECKISMGIIYRLENGEYKFPKLELVDKISNFYGIDAKILRKKVREWLELKKAIKKIENEICYLRQSDRAEKAEALEIRYLRPLLERKKVREA